MSPRAENSDGKRERKGVGWRTTFSWGLGSSGVFWRVITV